MADEATFEDMEAGAGESQPRVQKLRVPAGGTAVVVLSRPAPVRKPPRKKRPVGGEDVPPAPAVHLPGVALTLYDLGTRYREEQEDTGIDGITFAQSIYDELSMETNFFVSDQMAAEVRNRLIDSRARTTVAHSQRPIWTTSALQVSAETDGTVTTILLKHWFNQTAYRLDPLGDTAEWTKERTTADKIAWLNVQLTATAGTAAYQPTLAARNRAALELNENWDGRTAGRVGRQGTLRGYPLPGKYRLACESLVYRPWDTESADYRITEEPIYAGPEASNPEIRTGESVQGQAEIWLSPRTVEVFAQWLSTYEWGSLFNHGSVTFVQQRRWYNRLPWYPRSFSFGEVDAVGGNVDAMSEGIAGSRNYREMIAEDLSLNHFSLYFFFFLTARTFGRWQVSEADYLEGQLAAIIRVMSSDQELATRYVWRRTHQDRFGVISAGALFTAEVQGDPALF